jgi:penicillin-binding protein 1A
VEKVRNRVAVGNRADGGIFYWTGKLYGFAVLVVAIALVITAVSTYGYFANQAPPPPDLTRYSKVVPAVSRIYASDGTMLGEFANEWREIAAFDEMPEKLVQAFLAAEDHEFFEHRGIYFKGIARAAWRNVVAGDFAQGGSTITQQVAKQFLGSEKSLTRKAKEAIVARRLEATYSKEAILSVYMNHIFLGNGAYGVKAAAKHYYGKKLSELDIGEMALIAGLAQAPSRYSPVRSPAQAKERRNLILDKMVRYDFLDSSEADKWKTSPIVLEPYESVFGERHPFFAEHVRRYIVEKYGADALMDDGLLVEATVDPATDAIAYENIDFGARKQDKRQGWRGPEAYLDDERSRKLFVDRSEALYGDAPLIPGKRYLALVESADPRAAVVRVGNNTYKLPLSNMRWAAKWSKTNATNDLTITSVTRAIKQGDVIWVSKDVPESRSYKNWFLAGGVNPRWSPAPNEKRLEQLLADAEGRVVLEQVPHPQSALFTADHETGYVTAMVGGTDYARSQYNRAIQACRQPGSTYKPIYYSAALDIGYGYDTTLNDIPRAEIDPITGEVWRPTNLGGTVDTKVSLEYALVFSKNVPSVAIFKRVGADNVEKWARRLGFSTKIIADQALALGASCSVLDELTRAFAIFARNGRWIDWSFVKRIVDRDGNVLEDNTVFYDPMLTSARRLDRLATTAGVRAKQAIPARSAYLTSKLLRLAIQFGFSNVVRQAGINTAGKTGTSSATMDTTFVAYTSRWMTTIWLGDDIRERPLGLKDAAYMTVEPMWARYMREAAEGHPNKEIPWTIPDGVRNNDRGDHKKGPHARMPLVYKKSSKPTDPGDG